MTGIQAYALSRKLINGVASGVKNITVQGTQLVFQFNDGSSSSVNLPMPKDGEDGTSIVNIQIDDDNHLICTLSDGSIIDAGALPDNGVTDHRELSNRDAEEQHPIKSITGLDDVLKTIPSPVEALTNFELEEILK